MRPKALHLLLTYKCNLSCPHCFVWAGPVCNGRLITKNDARRLFADAKDIKTIDTVYLEGGEPFVLYRTMIDVIKEAYRANFKVGLITNCSWAISKEIAVDKLLPVRNYIKELIFSCDKYHNNYEFVKRAAAAAKGLNICARTNVIGKKKSPLRYLGRASSALIKDAPKNPWYEFNSCAYYDITSQSGGLTDPVSIHIDPYGYVQLCQGICIGNVFKTSLSKIIKEYNPSTHPIIAPILKGGPAQLARDFNLEGGNFADPCHLCYAVRCGLRKIFPSLLAPDIVYGIGHIHPSETRFA